MFSCVTSKDNDVYAKLISDVEAAIPKSSKSPVGRTISSKIPKLVYPTTLAASMMNSLPIPILLTVPEVVQKLALEKSIPLLSAAWCIGIIESFWMEWNKVKDRLKPEFDLALLEQNTVFQPGTIYFFTTLNNVDHVEIETLH